jgi:hypothetical protein
MYAYKAHTDVLYNHNANLWARVQHYTVSTRSAGAQYEMNQTRIFRLAKILLEESDQTIQEALEPLSGDIINYPWTNEEISLVLRAEQGYLNSNEEPTLDQMLDNLFDISHPDFTKEQALDNLHRSFTTPVGLCKECLMVKHQEELDRNQNTCDECVLIEETPDVSVKEIIEEPIEPKEQEYPQLIDQNQRIQQLEDRVQKLESLNRQLIQLLVNDSQQTNERVQQLTSLVNELNF